MLYIFVEGPDDYNYFEKIFGESFGEYKIIKYASMPQVKLNNFIRTIPSIPGSDYLFFGDEDGKGVANKKTELLSQYNSLSSSKLFIVQFEIESWYYAGVNQDVCKKLKLRHYQHDTNTLTKEQFYSKLSRPSERKYVMSQILTLYSKELAEIRNNSFNAFFSKIKEPAAV